MCQERLYNPTLSGHIIDHGQHIIAGGPHKRRSKDNGQVARLHLVAGGVGDDTT